MVIIVNCYLACYTISVMLITHNFMHVLKFYILLCNTLCGQIKGNKSYNALSPRQRGYYPNIAWEGGFQLSFDPPFDL